MKNPINGSALSYASLGALFALSLCPAHAQTTGKPGGSLAEGGAPSGFNPAGSLSGQSGGERSNSALPSLNPTGEIPWRKSGKKLQAFLLGKRKFLVIGGKGHYIASEDVPLHPISNRDLLEILIKEKETANENWLRAKRIVAEGTTTEKALTEANDSLKLINEEIKERSESIRWERFADGLSTIQAIKMKNGGLDNMLDLLSKCSRIKIGLDSEVKDFPTLDFDADRTPIFKVLSILANIADLEIVPSKDGIVLRKWPHVNNLIERSLTKPWSQEWESSNIQLTTQVNDKGAIVVSGIDTPFRETYLFQEDLFGFESKPKSSVPDISTDLPAGGSGLNPGGGAKGGGSGFPSSGSFPNGGRAKLGGGFSAGQPSGGGFSPSMGQGSMPFSFTSLGNGLVAVAEPGVNESGQSGVWMTAYRFENGDFKRLKSAFHAFKAHLPPLRKVTAPLSGGSGNSGSPTIFEGSMNRLNIVPGVVKEGSSDGAKSKKTSVKKP